MRLTATDAQGLAATTSVTLNPRTVVLTLASDPPGLTLALNSNAGPGPLTATLIAGSRNTVAAESPQVLGGRTYRFSSWSDAGAAAHVFTANSTGTLTARFSAPGDDGSAGAPAPPASDLRLRKLKVRTPKSTGRLIRRGGRAKLDCSVDCVVTMRLVAKGRDAERAGIEGTIARRVAKLDADSPTWLVAKLRRHVVRRLRAAKPGLQPRVTAKFTASSRN